MMTAKDLLAHLKETGTGSARLEALAKYCKENPEASGPDALGWMTTQETVFLRGTLEKSALFLGVPCPGANVTQETEDLRESLANTKKALAEVEAKNVQLAKRIAVLEGQLADKTKLEAPARIAKAERRAVAVAS